MDNKKTLNTRIDEIIQQQRLLEERILRVEKEILGIQRRTEAKPLLIDTQDDGQNFHFNHQFQNIENQLAKLTSNIEKLLSQSKTPLIDLEQAIKS